jgi:putative lipoic acid-binding regulatory protein
VAESESLAARERAKALLEATHQFPCAYALTVIAFNRDGVQDAVREAARLEGEERPDVEHEPRSSSGGRYLSHRLSVWVHHAEEVLELYARMKAIDGVVSIL